MAEGKNTNDLFSDEQRTAMNAIVAEQVKVALADSQTKIDTLEQEAKTKADAFEELKTKKEQAETTLAEKQKTEREVSVDIFMEKMRAGAGKYGCNEGWLKESGIEPLMRSLAHDAIKDKFTESDEKTTKLETFQSVIEKAVELAANGKLIIPKGEQAPGDPPQGLNEGNVQSDKFKGANPESVEIDAEIQKLAAERKIDLYSDPHGQHYWSLLSEVTKKRRPQVENRPPVARMV